MTLRIHIRELTDSVVARSMTTRYGIAAGLAPKAVSELAIAVSELATNVVKHAPGGVVQLRRTRIGVHLVVDDRGPGLLDPESLFRQRTTLQEPGEWRHGLGYGGNALTRMLDQVRAENRPGGGLRVHGVKRFVLEERRSW